MLFNLVTAIPLLVGVSSVLAEPAPYRIGMMSSDIHPMAFLKRQTGYQPTESYCGPGATCAESCGPGQETCPSNDGQEYCYNPTKKATCCPNLTGHSCKDGFYCTEDAQKTTWCCPNGMDLAACQAAYTITGALVSLTGSAGAPASSAAPAVTTGPPSADVSDTTTSTPPTIPTGAPSYGNATLPVVTKTAATTTTGIAAVTTTAKPVFTGGANSLLSDSGAQALAAGLLGLLAAL